ncbi:MAG: hypothetical protein IKN42_06535 [Elusimicrobia bacterium]|nr:hypothetical protein [Elusimicrobiota bacterium]
MINLVKKNIIKFEKIIPFLFKQINTGGIKISNFWILLKRSLTIWLCPVFLISVLFNQYETFNEYILWISVLYIGVIVLNYLKSNKVLLAVDKVILIVLAFFIFVNNKILSDKILFIAICLGLCIVLTYITMFFFYKKKGKNFVLNFSKLSTFIEFILAMSILIFGINSLITIIVLFVAMIDIFYKILILSITLNLKKRFNIQ